MWQTHRKALFYSDIPVSQLQATINRGFDIIGKLQREYPEMLITVLGSYPTRLTDLSSESEKRGLLKRMGMRFNREDTYLIREVGVSRHNARVCFVYRVGKLRK